MDSYSEEMADEAAKAKTLNLTKPKAILFDWDNTLVDTWPIIYNAMAHTFTEMGSKPWSLEETKQKVGHSMRDHFPKLFGDRWEEAGKIYGDSYKSKHLENLTPLVGALETLRFLNATEIFRAVVSNKQGPTLRQEAEHIGWDKYFHKLVGATDAARDKPFADPAILALKESGITPAPHVWFIGDSAPDVECALAAGLTPIVIDNKPLLKMYSQDITHVNNHAELKALIEEFI
jgi:phosphoglycolate phosphatase